MDIASVSSALNAVSSYNIGSSTSPVTLQENVGVAMLSKSMDTSEALGAKMVQTLEQSVTPYLGSSIDMYV